MILDWTQEQFPPITATNHNFRHLEASPHITPSRTTSLRVFVSEPSQIRTDPTNPPHSTLLVKTGSQSTQSSCICYLRLQQFDILSLQETNTYDSTIPYINMQLHSLQTFWTRYCDRFLLYQISHPHGFYEPYYILNLYAPADSNIRRRAFFDSLFCMLFQLHASDKIPLSRLIISWDLNYNYNRDIIRNNYAFKTSTDWVSFLLDSFYNCMTFNELDSVPTFQRNVSIRSVIDYIYAGYDIQHMIIDSAIEHIKPHYSLSTSLWKLVRHKLESLITDMSIDLSPQLKWEAVKSSTKQVIKSFGIKYVSWRALTLRQLQLVDVSKLKAGAIWGDNGERSARYLKQIHQQRTVQQYIASLQSAAPIYPNEEKLCTSDPAPINMYAQQYYQILYSVDTVEPT
ncbi:hypothetical protein EDC94DRAFT_694816 [Helicostylum pulchrum]|nr:hypothetical protein EDC94DRAFT_694816 [Helicostylum pulchrum]